MTSISPDVAAAEAEVKVAHDRVRATVAILKHRVDPRVIASEAAGRTKAQAQRLASDAGAQAQRLAGDAAAQAKRLSGDAATVVRNKPWSIAVGTTAVLTALVIGLRFIEARRHNEQVDEVLEDSEADAFEPLDRRQTI